MCFRPGVGCRGRWAVVLQAAVDPLDGVAFVFGDDALLDVRVDLLVHEILQLGQVIICTEGEANKDDGFNNPEI